MTTFLSRGIDYLGDLGAKLRDLRGDRTLAYELIQNADDARNATWMCFNVCDDALIVDNDGTFSDCGKTQEAECPWKEDGRRAHRCDFHRFRRIASGDKRGEAGTTGAFGIGFIAVYQITDRPEVISVSQHWILHEECPEDQRIEVCSGCVKCSEPNLPGTRFILPWAWSASSTLRQMLRAEPVSPTRPEQFLKELRESIPIAMLFLKRLRVIEIKGTGGWHRGFQRNDEGDSLILSDGNAENDRIWHLVRGDFSDAAAELRNKHLGRIEEKRSSRVIVAVPGRSVRAGFLCACLPTEQDIGLPFHVNADFFPTNDRKRIILADDYQSTWNREALRAAARAIGTAIERLPATLGPQQFWRLISAAKEVADSTAKDGESTFAEFWRAVEPHLRSAPVVYTTKDSWTTSSRASLLLQREENDVIPVLEGLGISVVHEDLRPYHNLLRSDSVGIPLLDIKTVCDALTSHGLDRRVKYDALPTILTGAAGQQLLWSEITRLLDRQQRTYKARLSDEDRLRQVAVAPGRDGDFWPCGQIYSADEATRILFESLDMGIPFVDSEEGFAALAFLCPPFDAAAAIDRLSAVDNEILDRAWQENRLPLKQLFAWFEDRRQEICGSEAIKQKLIKLQIFPSSEKLRTLQSVALPGNFDDPLRLAELVDLNALGGRREFLRDLGMPELDFRTYVLKYLPSVLKDRAVTADKRRAANVLLAKHIGELREYPEALRALTTTALVECSDDVFRAPPECYFDSDLIRECLGDAVCFAALPKDHQTAVRELYTWLGVAQKPRRGDVMKVIQGLGSKPYVHSAVTRMKRIITYLGTGFEAGDDPVDLMPLKSTRWLPARGKTDRWYAPNELYALYQAHLFESQALFLDLSDAAKSHSALLEFFGVKLTPPASLVVKHLVHCATQKVAVNAGVYRFLNDKAGDPSIDSLKNKSCLWLGGVYRAPFQVYWGEHPFGRYRWRLSEDLRSYNHLLTQLGVRDTPEYGDSFNVLKEISAEFGATNTPLDAETLSVVRACWQLLEKAFDERTVSSEQLRSLHSLKCIPNSDHILYPPEWIFFENRAGLAAKFGDFLTKNVIPRPLGGLRAFAAAGVRPLSSAVQIELLECTDPVDDPTMAQRIRSRRNQIGRVLESQLSGTQTSGALSQLDSIRCEATSSLVLRYRLRAFNRNLRSEPESTPAVFQRAENALMFTRYEGRGSWGAIARELAVALFPDEDPGRFAAGLKEVLAPESATEAGNVLDELGFAHLDTTVHETPIAGQAGGALGVDGPSSDFNAPSAESTSPIAPGYLSVAAALDRILGPDAPAPSRPISEATAEPSGVAGPSGTGKSSGQATQKSRPVLRSYIPSTLNLDCDSNNLDDQDNENGRSPVDIAGIRRVMEYELGSERIPKEMPHKNPGYDIESRDSSGKVVRFIEVKSFSGDWDSTYAVLSRRQFDKANELRDVFWLYVVERAESDDFRIQRIQNPALKANHFMFDDGWRATSEPETTTKEGI